MRVGTSFSEGFFTLRYSPFLILRLIFGCKSLSFPVCHSKVVCNKLCARYGDPVITFEVQESKKVTSLPSTGQLQKHQLKPINPDFTVADDGTKCS